MDFKQVAALSLSIFILGSHTLTPDVRAELPMSLLAASGAGQPAPDPSDKAQPPASSSSSASGAHKGMGASGPSSSTSGTKASRSATGAPPVSKARPAIARKSATVAVPPIHPRVPMKKPGDAASPASAPTSGPDPVSSVKPESDSAQKDQEQGKTPLKPAMLAQRPAKAPALKTVKARKTVAKSAVRPVKVAIGANSPSAGSKPAKSSAGKRADWMEASEQEALQLLAADTSGPAASRKAPKVRNVTKTQYPSLDFLRAEPPRGVTVLKSGVTKQVTDVDLAVGKAEVMYLSRPVSRVAVSNPDVAGAVIISPTQIQLIGKSVGVSNVLLWGDMGSHEHTVVDISVHRDVSVLESQLKYIDPGIQIAPLAAEDTVILTGQAETREAAQLAIEMAKAFFSKGGNSGGPPGMGATGGSGGASGASGGSGGPSSQAPGSALPGSSTNVINLIKVKGEPSTKLELVRQKLHEIDANIRIDVVPGPGGTEKVILSGRVPTAVIASRALNLASVFYGKPGLKMVTSQGGNDFARLQVESTSSSSGGSTSTSVQTGEAAGAANMLQGSVMTDASGNVISMLEIAQKPQIRCSIKFLELSKIAMNALGSSFTGTGGETKFTSWSGVQSPAPGKNISTPSSQSPPGADWNTRMARNGSRWSPTSQTFGGNWNEVFQSGVTQVFSINNQLIAAIQALQEKRQVRTLAEPTLTMLSGEQGSFLAGGEVPIAFLGGNGQISIEFKEYGIRLNLLPNMTDDGKIQMQVAPEVSAVDNSISVQGVPGFTTRRMNTSLLVEPGQSFILAGLFKQEDTDSVSSLPGIGNLPILGSFFKNQWKSRNHSEMVVLVRPEVIYSETGPTGNPGVSSGPKASLPQDKLTNPTKGL
jgi:Flp pilus assembly secretin CpaC